MSVTPGGTRTRVQGHETQNLSSGWEAAATAPGGMSDPRTLGNLDWRPAAVPGTAAGMLGAHGAWRLGDQRDFDTEDWWFRARFVADRASPGEEVVLLLEGLATVAEVHLNGELILRCESMFTAHQLDVGARLHGENELAIRFCALAPLLRVARRPRARWRTRVVADGALRFFRTTLLGRAPGFAPRPAPVGPWRPVRLQRRRALIVEDLSLIPRLSGADGILDVRVHVRELEGTQLSNIEVVLSGSSGTHRATLELEAGGEGVPRARGGSVLARGTLSLPSVAPWWPHTHGEPNLHEVWLSVTTDAGSLRVEGGKVGFRALSTGPGSSGELESSGLEIHVNSERVFCRGPVWTPADGVGLAPTPDSLRAALNAVRDAGMNMIRLPGTGVYESETFHDLCDELGLLVWQDFMFANLDYPFSDDGFRAAVHREAVDVLRMLRGRPSIAVLCGNSEIEQQVAMLGLDPALGRGEMFAQTLPALARDVGLDAVYVPSAPCGGELPFRPNQGVANYFGVGAYRRPLQDARLACVRFASECLAFANVPGEAGVEAVAPGLATAVAVHDPRWKAGVPRDVGAGWDFEDVRDHYLALLFGVEPVALRSVDPAHYLELSRAVTGEVMEEVFGEWRRDASPCGGGLVLWWRDLLPGAGWGLIDHSGEPKVAYHHLRRALAPVAVWTTDEGLGGVAVHVANERPEPLRARLRVALYRNFEECVAEAHEDLLLAPRGTAQRSAEGMVGRFVDASWAYRFGPPAQDAIVVSLESDAEPRELLSQSVRFPAGRPLRRESAAQMGLEAKASTDPDGSVVLNIRARRLVYGLRVHVPGFTSDDDAFSVEPGGERVVRLDRTSDASALVGGSVTALNLDGGAPIARH